MGQYYKLINADMLEHPNPTGFNCGRRLMSDAALTMLSSGAASAEEAIAKRRTPGSWGQGLASGLLP